MNCEHVRVFVYMCVGGCMSLHVYVYTVHAGVDLHALRAAWLETDASVHPTDILLSEGKLARHREPLSGSRLRHCS